MPSESTRTTRSKAKKISSKVEKPIRVTHVLDSSLKFNIALALSGDNPTFLCSGSICLNCALKQTVELSVDEWEKAHGRFLINCFESKPENGFKTRLLGHSKR